MYYGFETTEEWLVEYTKAEYGRRRYVPNPPCSDYAIPCESFRKRAEFVGSK
jgi:hypothetical protein